MKGEKIKKEKRIYVVIIEYREEIEREIDGYEFKILFLVPSSGLKNSGSEIAHGYLPL